MTRLIEILISLAIVTALFLLVAVVLPSGRHLNETVETNRKMTIVYDTLDSVRRFRDWNPLVLHDPKMQLRLSGPPSGVGAHLDYESNNPLVGKGSWEIVADEPGRSVTYALTNPARGQNKKMTFQLLPTGRAGRNVEVTQKYDVTYGWDLLGRYAGLYVSRHVGDDMKLGLERLSNTLAQVPNIDYRVQGSKLADLTTVDVPAENLLVVSAGSIDRDNQKIKDSMNANMEWIKRSMEASGLAAAGPMRIITSELGREKYTFDVAVPVRRRNASDKIAIDKSADSKAGKDKSAKDKPDANLSEMPAIAPDMAPVVDQGELIGLKLMGPVTYVRTEAGRAARASYTGYLAELENVRDALRAWALTQGLQVTGRPYEVYKNGIDAAFTADGQYDVYWILKSDTAPATPAR